MKVTVLAVFLPLASASGVFAQQPVAPLPPASSAQAAAQGQSNVFRSGASLVALNVTVSDGKRFVGGLAAGDFAVYEDGVQQRVEFFESSSVPIDLILLVDCSSSMRDKMGTVQEAALGFLKTLRAGDRGAVVSFADRVEIRQPLTTDTRTLERAVTDLQAGGATALNNAVYIALKEFARPGNQSDVRRQAIAVLSDGDDTASLMSFDDVMELARKSSVNVYTIALKTTIPGASRQYFSNSDYTMKTLAQETGAQSFFPGSVFDLKKVYASIADELANQYSLGYTPTNGRLDGRFRRIVVRMQGHPELRPRFRKGYTADAVAAAALQR